MSDTEERLRAQLMAEEINAVRRRQGSPVTLRVDIELFDLFRVIGALQLAWRHPGLDEEQRAAIEGFARQLTQSFEGPDTPQLALTLQQGWQREYDR